MAIPVYLWLKDDGGAYIKGSVDVTDREGSIEITELQHTILLPTDNLTGRITAKRQHSSYYIEKIIDSSSVYLYQALCTGKTLKSAELKFYRINDAGQEEEYFNTLLTNVKVTAVTPMMLDIKDPLFEKHGHIEGIEFRYEEITWKYVDGNIIHSDLWNQRA
ncbi:TPA: type VI secretion system tube protein TssD [Citrobacter freundii]